MSEAWRPIPGYEGLYEVSDIGRVRSLGSRARVLKLISLNGYLKVNLSKEGKRRQEYVHRLLAEAFIRSPIPKHLEVCHGDGNRENNILHNIRLDTRRSNAQDRKAHGTELFGERHHNSKLSEDQVIQIRSSQESARLLAEKFGVSSVQIRNVKKGTSWAHVKKDAS